MIIRIIAIFAILFLLGGCQKSMDATSSYSSSALPNTFTTKNILKVHQGMSSDKILKLFGEPKSIRSSICGGATGPSWRCTTWKYGNFPYDNANFTFSGEHGLYKLNNFDINRD